jgi:hypothetical protein
LALGKKMGDPKRAALGEKWIIKGRRGYLILLPYSLHYMAFIIFTQAKNYNCLNIKGIWGINSSGARVAIPSSHPFFWPCKINFPEFT